MINELSQITIDGTSIDTIKVELEVRQLENINIRVVTFQANKPFFKKGLQLIIMILSY